MSYKYDREEPGEKSEWVRALDFPLQAQESEGMVSESG